MPASTATTQLITTLAGSNTLTDAQHRFVAAWPDVNTRRVWSARHDIAADIAADILATEDDTEVLVALLANTNVVCGPGDRRLYQIRGVRLAAIANAQRNASDDIAVLNTIIAAAWKHSKTRFTAELTASAIPLTQLPVAASIGAIRYGNQTLAAAGAAAHSQHPDIRDACARRALSYSKSCVQGAARHAWSIMPAPPADTSLRNRLAYRAELYRNLPDGANSYPAHTFNTLQVVANPDAITELIESRDYNTDKIANAVVAHTSHREALSCLVIGALDAHDPSGVEGFALAVALQGKVGANAFYTNEITRRAGVVGQSVCVVGEMIDILTRSNLSLPDFQQRRHNAGVLRVLLAANVGLLAQVVADGPGKLANSQRFVAAVPFDQLDVSALAAFAARSDLLGDAARNSAAIPDEMLLGWSVELIKKYPNLWARLVAFAAERLEPWQLILLEEMEHCTLSVDDALASLATL